jgi:two-component system alkaline phosphatase synthesis response regulator PhoP
MSRVLLVEDDEHLAEGMVFNLRNSGYEVETTTTGEDALQTMERRAFDLVLLDLMLPGIDGLEVVRRLRRAGNKKPVLIITARNRADDTIAGLDAGADDYITKPFDLDEVLARIRGALRRQAWARASSPSAAPDSLRYGRWTIDFQTFVATGPDGRTQTLTVTELAMLKLFARRPGQVISRETFLDQVWGRTGALETRTVDNFVRKLRRALEEHPARPRHIVSVRGAGYKFVP